VVAEFEASAFNAYSGPRAPELLLITGSVCYLYSKEAISLLGVEDRVGLLKLGTTWPLPPKLMEKCLGTAGKVLVVEEVIAFLEENVKITAAELASKIGPKTFFGKREGTLPQTGEMNSDLVAAALSRILSVEYEAVPQAYAARARELSDTGAPGRDLTFCAGCPHRASFWTIHNTLQLDGRQGFVCGDIGCYSMAILPTGFNTLKTLHAMGSGLGLASGFGKLGQFGMEQPVVAVVGDSTRSDQSGEEFDAVECGSCDLRYASIRWQRDHLYHLPSHRHRPDEHPANSPSGHFWFGSRFDRPLVPKLNPYNRCLCRFCLLTRRCTDPPVLKSASQHKPLVAILPVDSLLRKTRLPGQLKPLRR
ncbi:hypothetical protein ACFL2S_15965, partial [Thermodesulfobacteriota bacterium]